ncbi:MAG: AmmeMemoRadiSam system protein B [bacterium]|nr:AmmeMemoRadiSam system protein B [bacterium]
MKVTHGIVGVLGVIMVMAPYGVGADEKSHRSRFFMYADYISRVEYDKVPQEKAALATDPLAGVIPHHAPTTFPLMAEFYARLKATKKIDTFVVVGPDHFNTGKGMAMVSRMPFDVPEGRVEQDLVLVKQLTDKGLAVVDEAVYEREHSMDTQLVFIKHYFPHAKVVQLVYNARITEGRARDIGKALAQMNSRRIFFVASVDFSHYLTAAQARPIDVNSQRLLEGADPVVVSRVVADSPGSLTTLLTYVKEKGATALRPFRVYNTADFTNNKSNTTGYVTGYFGLPNAPQHTTRLGTKYRGSLCVAK